MNYLIDTSTIISFLRGKEEAKRKIMGAASKGTVSISVITFGELLYGAYRSGNFGHGQEKIIQFITDFSIMVLPLTTEIIHEYAKVKYHLEKNGSKLDELDLLIGATAVTNESTLITDNVRHFQRFPDITLYQRQ